MNKNWSMNLEGTEYQDNIKLLVEEAIEAVNQTEQGFYVNLVTPEIFGNPEVFLSKLLDQVFTEAIRQEYIDQCGCGGYVYRVWKL